MLLNTFVVLSVSALAVATTSGFAQTCKDLKLNSATLEAKCYDGSNWIDTELDLNDCYGTYGETIFPESQETGYERFDATSYPRSKTDKHQTQHWRCLQYRRVQN